MASLREGSSTNTAEIVFLTRHLSMYFLYSSRLWRQYNADPPGECWFHVAYVHGAFSTTSAYDRMNLIYKENDGTVFFL